ncbi:uncharacterized protein [Amphiura filiformis]|uniref:uncharacterized protein n=1 Tax=Amphiura filiformis TaxID=82378 RepID=UPI003B217F7A
MDFAVENKGDQAFSFTALLHTYLRVEDVTKTTVSNLKGLKYVDKVKAGDMFTEDRELVSLAENYDRVYQNTPDEHVVMDGESGRTVIVKKTNFPDTVVWNPWADKAKGMSDFGDDEYPNMICVEAGHVSSAVTLTPGDTFHGNQVLNIVQ